MFRAPRGRLHHRHPLRARHHTPGGARTLRLENRLRTLRDHSRGGPDLGWSPLSAEQTRTLKTRPFLSIQSGLAAKILDSSPQFIHTFSWALPSDVALGLDVASATCPVRWRTWQSWRTRLSSCRGGQGCNGPFDHYGWRTRLSEPGFG